MRKFLSVLLLAAGVLAPASLCAAPAQQVLLVVSSHGKDHGRAQPGFEFDEFAQAYTLFRDNGLEVDVASPQGGKVEADPYDPKKPYNARVLGDEQAMAKLGATRATGSVQPGNYAAVFVIGGKGAMFDLPKDTALQALIARIYEAGGVIGAVCHGPAALVDVRLADGSLLVAGKAVTGFTNEEEMLFGKTWAKTYAFLLEDALRARGARFAEADIMLPFVQVDGRIVTGQNPFSTPLAVEATLRAMGRTPTVRAPYADERSLQLIARFLKGETAWAKAELAAQRQDYDASLIGMYGYARTQDPAADTQVLAAALALMELAAPYFATPRLELAMAQTEHRLGSTAAARQRIEKLLAQKPDMEEAKTFLATLKE